MVHISTTVVIDAVPLTALLSSYRELCSRDMLQQEHLMCLGHIQFCHRQNTHLFFLKREGLQGAGSLTAKQFARFYYSKTDHCMSQANAGGRI